MSVKEVYIDGSCINQGHRKIAQGGIGVYWGPNNEDNKSETMKGPATNTGAELQAAARAINIARGRNECDILRIFTDSETVHNAERLLERHRERGWHDASDRRSEVEFRHVKAHSGNQHNEAANRLAREGARRYRPGYY